MPKYEVTFHYEREFDLVVEADSLEDARAGVEDIFEFYKLDYILDTPEELGIDSIEDVDNTSHVEYVFEKDDDEEDEEDE